MQNNFHKSFVKKANELFGKGPIPLHRPVFEGNEKKYLLECIDSNFVSSAGKKVDELEKKIAQFTGSKYAIATVNGTSALHVALVLAGINFNDEVITQPLTFIATCNAIRYANASPVFVDVDKDTMGMSPAALESFLKRFALKKDGKTINKLSNKQIKACIPMHTFGLPCRIAEIKSICDDWGIILIEDAAESLGSYSLSKHTGTYGQMGTLSFNGNKVITTGGGGMIITDSEEIAIKAKHITTTSKVPHAYEYIHDEVGYNYRLPNLNAALGCAQMEKLENFLLSKLELANQWREFFDNYNIKFIDPIEGSVSNYWLNAICFETKKERDQFLKYTNKHNVMTRPIWSLMSKLEMYKECYNDGIKNSIWLEERIVNIPSSAASTINKI
jgi:aminotransferase in exopolysaccharide biosynthesis